MESKKGKEKLVSVLSCAVDWKGKEDFWVSLPEDSMPPRWKYLIIYLFIFIIFH